MSILRSFLDAIIVPFRLSAVQDGQPTGLAANTGFSSANTGESLAGYNAADWKLIWSDEFDAPGLPDPAKWDYEVGFVRNAEPQFYTKVRPENITVADSQLVITARKESWQGAAYTSASLTTLGKFEFTYGKVEISAKVPTGRGIWPALWTLGSEMPKVNWPKCGEIDLMEFIGLTPDQVYFNVHTGAFNHVTKTGKGTNIVHTDMWREFHTYGLVWSPRKLEWFFDGRPVFAFENDGQGPDHWPFDLPQYLLVNLAVGGSWAGAEGIDDALFPAEFRVDYVRIWQRP
ncbi:MAG: glycoside hydrolase family 16 protein [Opitutaceae bacterium]|jgi:beta-glucanase (GH16 family)